MASRKPAQFKMVFALDKPPTGWTGEQGYVNAAMLKKYLPAPALADKTKIFICELVVLPS